MVDCSTPTPKLKNCVGTRMELPNILINKVLRCCYVSQATGASVSWGRECQGQRVSVTTMSNSGPYPVTPVASQLYSSTPVAHHLLRSRSRRYTSVKYDPWPSPYSVLTTPHRLPCLDVSSPCTCYIHHLVSFSPDLFYFTRA